MMKKYVLATLLLFVGWMTTAATSSSILLASSPNIALSVPNAQVMSFVEPGFPVQITPSAGHSNLDGPASNVVVANIDADPSLEMIAAIHNGGPLGAWNADGTSVRGWPVVGMERAMGQSAAGNLNPALPGSEIVTVYSAVATSTAQLYAYAGSGMVLPGFPVNFSSNITSAPVLADLTNDGIDEILFGTMNGDLHVYTVDGTPLSGWPYATGGMRTGTPVIVDLDGNGSLDIVFITFDPGSSGTAYLYTLRPDATPLTGFPAIVPRRDPWFITGFPVAGDVDGDGEIEIVFMGNESNTARIIYIYNHLGTQERVIPYPQDAHRYASSAPALADLDGDGIPEIVAQSYRSTNVWYGDGTSFPGWPATGGDTSASMTPVIGDITGDGLPEIVTLTKYLNGCSTGYLMVYDRNGEELQEFSHYLKIGSGSVPAIADIDRDKRNEVIVASTYSTCAYSTTVPQLWAFDFGGEQHGAIQWGQFGNGAQHTGVYHPVPTSVDLSVSMTDDPDPFPAGGKTRYQISVNNLGSQAATEVTLTNTLPSGVTLDEVIPSQGSCVPTSDSIGCDLGKIINGGIATVEHPHIM